LYFADIAKQCCLVAISVLIKKVVVLFWTRCLARIPHESSSQSSRFWWVTWR